MSRDIYNVNVCNSSASSHNDACGGGSIFRLIVELDPNGVTSYNALPGGQVWRISSPHFRDELDLYLDHQRHPIAFHPQDVASAHTEHLLFSP